MRHINHSFRGTGAALAITVVDVVLRLAGERAKTTLVNP